jgi:hypothetical protein
MRRGFPTISVASGAKVRMFQQTWLVTSIHSLPDVTWIGMSQSSKEHEETKWETTSVCVLLYRIIG